MLAPHPNVCQPSGIDDTIVYRNPDRTYTHTLINHRGSGAKELRKLSCRKVEDSEFEFDEEPTDGNRRVRKRYLRGVMRLMERKERDQLECLWVRGITTIFLQPVGRLPLIISITSIILRHGHCYVCFAFMNQPAGRQERSVSTSFKSLQSLNTVLINFAQRNNYNITICYVGCLHAAHTYK